MSQDIRNLGTYANIAALWAAHPEGGREGDYATVSGTRYRWNKYDRIWENGATVTQTTGTRNHLVEGDQEVTGDMTILGTLKAKHVKQPHMGMYASEEALLAALPTPEKGWYALVGNELPAELYVCNTAGTWTDTGNEYDGESVDLTNYVLASAFEGYKDRGYKILGDATPSTIPSSPTKGDAYLASTPGTYEGFGDITLEDGQLAVFKYNGSAWSASLLRVGKSYDSEMRELNVVASKTIKKTQLDVTDYEIRSYQLLTTGKYGTNSAYKHILIPVNPGDSITIKSNDENSAQCAWFSDNSSPSGGGTAKIVTGTERFYVVGETTYVVPEGAFYLYVYRGAADDYPYTPVSIVLNEALTPAVRQRLDRARVDETAGVGLVLDSVDYDKRTISIESLGLWDYSIIGQNYGTSTSYKHTRVFVTPGEICRIKAPEDAPSYVYFLTDVTPPTSGGAVPFVSGEDYRIVVQQRQEILFIVPDECFALLIYLGRTSDSYPNKPALLEIYDRKTDGLYAELNGPLPIPVIVADGYSARASIVADGVYSRLSPVKANKRYQIDIEFVYSSAATVFYGLFSSLPVKDLTRVDGDAFTRSNVKHSFVFTPEADGYFLLSSVGTIDSYDIKEVNKYDIRPKPSVSPSEKLKDLDLYEDDILKLIEATFSFNDVDFNNYTKRNYWINDINVYSTNNAAKHIVISVTPGGYIKVTASEYWCYLAWLTSDDAPVANGEPAFVPGTIRFSVGPGETGLFRIPSGAAFLYVYRNTTSGSVRLPSRLAIGYPGSKSSSSVDNGSMQIQTLRHRVESRSLAMGLTSLSHQVDQDGWELPQTIQQLNALKKAMQMRELRWTPLADLQGKHDTEGTAHRQGVEQRGVPYSGNWHEYKYVGIEVSFETFMTAVHNPYSLLYTENIHRDYSKSAWGKTYYNTNGWMYYGTVCCGLTSSVVGQPTKYGNTVYPKVARYNGIFVPVYPQRDVNALKLGDVCDNNAHSFMVFGLHRDANGNVDKVKIVESTGANNAVRYLTYNSPQEWYAALDRAGDPYTVFRVADLYKNIDYAPSKYVPLTSYGEEQQAITYNDDICCFAGNKACFMEGDLVVVNYNLTASPSYGWTGIEVYKDDVLIDTYALSSIDQSGLDSSQQSHALKLGTELAPGKYKARMTDGTHNSDYTYWEVLPNEVTIIENSDGSYTISANSDYPMVYVYLGQLQEAGWFYNKAGREPDWVEANKNEMVLYHKEMLEAFEIVTDANYVRVMFRGDYGMAATPAILLPGKDSGNNDEGSDDEQDDVTE